MLSFLKKHREILAYLIVGGMTTVIGLGTYFLILFLARTAGVREGSAAYGAVRVVAQILQWILAVLFAYVANKKWVFCYEEDRTKKQTAVNFVSFVTSRLVSLGADSLVTFGTIWALTASGYVTREVKLLIPISLSSDFWGKLLAAIVVVILNYVLGKFIVFRKTHQKKS
ncbi:MAG: GtrA family protein [Ruminococcaceae bacterium]|nr:GtrA family protein [Oscillospiraceae bacterium]